MSLTSLIKAKDISEKLKPLRPRIPHRIAAKLRAAPRSKRYMLVGTAFDYLFRFEIQRRNPQAVAQTWVAETAANRIVLERNGGAVCLELFHDAAPGSYLPPEEISRLAKVIVEQAKGDLRTFVRNCSPSRESVRNMAQHAIKLAYLDDIFRAGRLDKHFQDDVPAEEVNDLVELLDIVPFETLLDNRNVLLNPTFGDKASKLVGGADADLIVGSHLIDIKVTISDSVKPQHLDQLLGYFFLTRYCQRAGDSCPDVSRAGIYFARHGYLLSFGTDEWLNNPHFGEIEGWFLARAQSQIMHLKMLT